MRVYILEEGILLSKDNKEYDFYGTVYDKEYGYYNEVQCYLGKLHEAIESAKKYVEKGVNMTYAIVSKTDLTDDTDLEDEDLCVQGEKYLVEDVVYSVAKINGKIVENFIKKSDTVSIF